MPLWTRQELDAQGIKLLCQLSDNHLFLLLFNKIERENPFRKRGDESKIFMLICGMEFCQPADRMDVGRITCNSKHACDRKVEWLSMEGKAPSDRGEFRPVEVPPVTVEAGSPVR